MISPERATSKNHHGILIPPLWQIHHFVTGLRVSQKRRVRRERKDKIILSALSAFFAFIGTGVSEIWSLVFGIYL